jgi:exopolyphosphatase/guanosine-5'-triphosphate,3'-diphosphate pyrophosphatase
VVATAAIRAALNRDEFLAGMPVTVEILDEDEEARLAFLGATRMLTHPVEGEVAVVDVGGGSSEVAVGTIEDGVRWSESWRVGSGFLADSYLRSDPPAIEELEAVRAHVAGTFEGFDVQPPALAVAVGGSATSLRRLVGAELDHETLERGVRVLATTPIAEVAERFELDPERVRLLPAGILVLEALSDRLRLPLRIARGGLREGVLLELMAAREAA